MTFAAGQRVRCVRGFDHLYVKTGTEFTVSAVGKTSIELKGIDGRWPACRFEAL